MVKNLFLEKSRQAFTLLELIIYVALSTFVLIFLINIGQNLISSNVKAQAIRELATNGRSAINQLTQSLRNADGVIITDSSFNLHPGILTLDYPGNGTNIIIDTYTKNILLPTGETLTIRKLRIKEGSLEYQDLTNDKVDITNFMVKNLTRGSEPENINIELTLHQLNAGNDPDYNASVSLETAISLRK